MNLLIVGPQASGKGTQAEKLVQKFGLAYVQMGEIFRKIKEQDTLLARRAKEYYEKGILVPDDIVVELIHEYLQGIGRLDGIIFDGFPRVVSQAKYFDQFLEEKGKKIDLLLFITLPREVTLARLANRLTCPKCQQIYNTVTKKPKVNGICDTCGEKLVVRSDETPQAIETRLNEFWTKTKPMIDYYKEKGMVEEVDGNRPIEMIFADIVEKLKKRGLIKDA